MRPTMHEQGAFAYFVAAVCLPLFGRGFQSMLCLHMHSEAVLREASTHFDSLSWPPSRAPSAVLAVAGDAPVG